MLNQLWEKDQVRGLGVLLGCECSLALTRAARVAAGLRVLLRTQGTKGPISPCCVGNGGHHSLRIFVTGAAHTSVFSLLEHCEEMGVLSPQTCCTARMNPA